MNRYMILAVAGIVAFALLTRNWEAMTADQYFKRAETSARMGAFSHAIKDYNNAIEMDPEHVESFRKRAIANMNIANHKTAIEDQNAALSLRPDYASVYYDRGISYYFLEDFKKACRDMDTACALGLLRACAQVQLAC